MKLEFNEWLVKSFDGNVDEYLEIKDIINPEWIDLSEIPMCLGNDAPSRINKFMEYRKNGVIIHDSRQNDYV